LPAIRVAASKKIPVKTISGLPHFVLKNERDHPALILNILMKSICENNKNGINFSRNNS
jgi:hypothetical protein